MGDVLPFAQAVKFPCALHLLILFILLYLLIQSLNNLKYGSWWSAACCSMLTLTYLLLANILSICLGMSRIYSRSKEIAIEKFWETNCDRSRRVEAGGRFMWWRCPLQQSLHLSHSCSRTCNVAAATCSLKAGLGKRSSCTPSLIVGIPQLSAAAQLYRLVQRRHRGESLRSFRRNRHTGMSITEAWCGIMKRNTV